MRRFVCLLLLAFLNISLASASASSITSQPHHQGSGGFASWMAGTSYLQPTLAPSSPDNWLGGMGIWSNSADWSAGEPGGSSDVFINTGNDNVTLDVNASCSAPQEKYVIGSPRREAIC